MKHYIEPREGTPIQSKMQLPEKLRELRVNSGYTQQQVADVLDCSRSTYTYYETGKSSPDLPTLVMLAKIFNVSIAELLEEEKSSTMVRDSGRALPRKKTVSHIYDLNPDELSLISYYRVLSEKEKEEILAHVRELRHGEKSKTDGAK